MRLNLALLVSSVLLFAAPVQAAGPDWDRTENVREAATQLVKRHKASGSNGVIKFLDACYRTHMLASKYSRAIEGCLAQDYIHSRVLVAIYAKLPDAARADPKLPSAADIAKAVNGRFITIFQQYKVSVKDADALKAAIEQHGVPVFLKERFPAPAAGSNGDKRP